MLHKTLCSVQRHPAEMQEEGGRRKGRSVEEEGEECKWDEGDGEEGAATYQH